MVGVTPTHIPHLRAVSDTDTSRTTSRTPSAMSGLAGAAGPEGAQTDSLTLSVQARGLPEAMLKGPPVDRALVERLSTAIAEGQYPINPAAIAEAMCRDCFDLPN